MTELETSILNSLIELDNKVKTMATANPKENLIPLFQRIDDMAAKLPSGTDPDLIHYLTRKSYEKARLLLEGRKAENKKGSCGR
jgi:hypothetical protein